MGSAGAAAMQSTDVGPTATDAGKLLRTSMSVMRHRLHSVHASGVLENGACCPRISAQARFTGDCTLSGTSFALRFSQQGTTVEGKKVVPVDTKFVIAPSASKSGPWERSLATHNRWRVDISPTKDADIAVYICPLFAMAQYTSHFPAHLVNLGTVNVHGVAAWHLRDRLAMTSGAFKGTVYQTDFYLAQASSYWIRFGYLYDDGSTRQHAVEDYSGFNVPVHITAPMVGSSTP